MVSGLFRFVFNIYFLFVIIKLTLATNDNSVLQLSVYPNSGYSTENIEIRCQILQPSIYDNVYLSVKSDNVKPSGILLMVDDTINQCRINENKEKYIHVYSCNSTLILININHRILNDSIDTINYACTQGELNVFSSYRILKENTARYYDRKSANTSSSLTHTYLLLLLLLILTTIREFR